MKLIAIFHPENQLRVSIRAPSLIAVLGIPVAREYVDRHPYEGPYTITPGRDAQTLPTKNFRMTEDIVVGAIPSNYGLVTWNGSVLTIS